MLCPQWQVLLGWVGTSAMGLVLVYGMANYNTADDPDPLPLSVSIMYGGFSHGAWALALLWVVFACHTGYGGKQEKFDEKSDFVEYHSHKR